MKRVPHLFIMIDPDILMIVSGTPGLPITHKFRCKNRQSPGKLSVQRGAFLLEGSAWPPENTANRRRRCPGSMTLLTCSRWMRRRLKAALGMRGWTGGFKRCWTVSSAALAAASPLPVRTQAATKAACRFFSNPRVSEAGILAGHFEAVRARVQAADGLILIMHDTGLTLA
jgi:hypothetical protein